MLGVSQSNFEVAGGRLIVKSKRGRFFVPFMGRLD
jgi:hypothetical protein